MSSPNAPLLEKTRAHYEKAGSKRTWAARCYQDWLAHYYNLLIPGNASVLEIGCGTGELLSRLKARDVTGIDLSEGSIASAKVRIPHGKFHRQAGEELSIEGTFDYIIISDTLNFAADAQEMLERLKPNARRDTRLILNFASALWRPIFAFAETLGLRARHPQSSWLSVRDVKNLLVLSEWTSVRTDSRILIPVKVLGIDWVANRWLAPFLPILCLCVFCVARPAAKRTAKAPVVSVIVPARNEAGNIRLAVDRTPEMGSGTEMIFVEGHSSDQTWEEMESVRQAFPSRKIVCLKQTGTGKGDAVRLGLAAATGDMVMILDADLTVPPEDLPKFYELLVSGKAEFGNGVRLVYPMEKEAMRFLNLCANKAFGMAFSWILGQSVKDVLCGTKALWKEDFLRIDAHRAYFGDFDPFGDFDLLFGADRQLLHIRDIPIRYKDRTYGSTNIQRWRHGWLLLRMTLFAARRLKFV